MSAPYIGFTSDQIDKNPELGLTAQCPNCGTECEIKDTSPPMLQFIACCGREYLVGIEGRDIQGVDPFVSGDMPNSGGRES